MEAKWVGGKSVLTYIPGIEVSVILYIRMAGQKYPSTIMLLENETDVGATFRLCWLFIRACTV